MESSESNCGSSSEANFNSIIGFLNPMIPRFHAGTRKSHPEPLALTRIVHTTYEGDFGPRIKISTYLK